MEREVNIYNIYRKRERERREWKEGEVEIIYNVYNKERGRGRKRGERNNAGCRLEKDREKMGRRWKDVGQCVT